ncbi:hypothetical protein VTN02DRAFT_6193 [Thermoascus thermophilus]
MTARVALLALLALILILVLHLLHLPRAYATAVRDLRHRPGEGRRGAVASESAICSRIGTDMFTMGGNAADALVATVFCVGVIGMYHSGIGGGGFMLVRSPDGAFESVDFRETAPAAAFQDMYRNNTDASIYGGLASGVPGEIRGLEHLHKTYGRLPWATVMQPAIRVAREGFPVTADLVRYMNAAVADGEDFLSQDPTWALDFAPNGTRLGLGDTITRKRYADTLEAIATQGPDAFYSGPIAETMVHALRAANGTMTLDDLKNYTVAVRNVSQIDYRGYRITSTTAPSSGIVALSVLKILDGYDDFFAPAAVNLSTHRLDEAIRFGYGQRTHLGDPSFVDGLDEYQREMLNDSTVRRIRGRISDFHTQNVSAYDPDGIESLETPGTSHVVAADHTGLAISLTTTINLLFGSRLMVPETGIIMNNEMNDFSIPGSSNAFGYIPSPANYIRPGKRPLSSISPCIVTHPNGTLFFVVGAAGGSRIITATVQNIIHAVDGGLSAAEALAQPRLHDQLVPNQVSFEYAYDNRTVAFMDARGHNVTWVAPGESTAQAIRVLPNGTFDAAGEPRQLDSGVACQDDHEDQDHQKKTEKEEKKNTNTNPAVGVAVGVAVEVSPPSLVSDFDPYRPFDETVFERTVDDILLNTATAPQDKDETGTATMAAAEVIDLTSPVQSQTDADGPDRRDHADHNDYDAYDSQAEEDQIFASVSERNRSRLMTFITTHEFMQSYTPPILRSARRRFTKKLRRRALKAGMDEAATERLVRYIRRCYVELYAPQFRDGFDSDGSAFGPEEVDDEITPSNTTTNNNNNHLPIREKKRKRQLTDDGNSVVDKFSRIAKRRSGGGLGESRHGASPDGNVSREPDRGDSPLVLDLLRQFAESPAAKHHDPPQNVEKGEKGEKGAPEVIVVEDDDGEDQPDTGRSAVSDASHVPLNLEEESAASDAARPQIQTVRLGFFDADDSQGVTAGEEVTSKYFSRKKRRRATPQQDALSKNQPVPHLPPPPPLPPRAKPPRVSPYFSKPPVDASCLPFPPISAPSFGLIQERLAHDPFRLLIATIFLNRTRGGVAIPVLFRVFERYPTVDAMAGADVEELVSLIHRLGFQNQRARKCIALAKTWLAAPPTKGKRYRKLHYPRQQDGRDVGRDECIDDDDPRVAWEIAHLPGIGAYAIDSWRIFCRDALRGLATDWRGTGATAPEFTPEWKSVLPRDKELRAYLTWLWLKEGWRWDRETGERTPASEKLMRAAERGGVAHEEEGNWVLETSPGKAVDRDVR